MMVIYVIISFVACMYVKGLLFLEESMVVKEKTGKLKF